MRKQYVVVVFLLCFSVWALVVDNVSLSMEGLRQDVGEYTRYKVKKWEKDGKLDLLEDELLVYAVVDNREQLYYMEHKPYYEAALRLMPKGTPVQLRYAKRFPKFWKKHLYDLRVLGVSTLRYTPKLLEEKQREVWKFSGIMCGAFLFLVVLGFLNKPRRG